MRFIRLCCTSRRDIRLAERGYSTLASWDNRVGEWGNAVGSSAQISVCLCACFAVAATENNINSRKPSSLTAYPIPSTWQQQQVRIQRQSVYQANPVHQWVDHQMEEWTPLSSSWKTRRQRLAQAVQLCRSRRHAQRVQLRRHARRLWNSFMARRQLNDMNKWWSKCKGKSWICRRI